MLRKTIYTLAATALLTGCESEWTGLATGTSYNFDMHAIMAGNYQQAHSTTVGPFKTLTECKSAITRAEASLKSIMPERSFMTGYECCENAEWVTHLRIECTDIVNVPLPRKKSATVVGEGSNTENTPAPKTSDSDAATQPTSP